MRWQLLEDREASLLPLLGTCLLYAQVFLMGSIPSWDPS